MSKKKHIKKSLVTKEQHFESSTLTSLKTTYNC